MKRVLNILAQVFSAIYCPLLVPTYGMTLFCYSIHQMMPLPTRYWLVSIGVTLLLTGVLPITLICYHIKRGSVQDLYISRREERTITYIETAIGFALWWYVLAFVVNAPIWLSGIAIGGTIAIIIVAIINHWWKISAHLTGMGGLLGGLITYALVYHTFPLVMIIIIAVLSLLVMYARLYLNAHTSWQVIAGWALGIVCTILIPMLFYA